MPAGGSPPSGAGVESTLRWPPALATVARRLPRGWAHLALQFAFWLGFYVVYQVARGVADREGVATAFANGEWIIDFQRSLNSMIELTAAAGGRELRRS